MLQWIIFHQFEHLHANLSLPISYLKSFHFKARSNTNMFPRSNPLNLAPESTTRTICTKPACSLQTVCLGGGRGRSVILVTSTPDYLNKSGSLEMCREGHVWHWIRVIPPCSLTSLVIVMVPGLTWIRTGSGTRSHYTDDKTCLIRISCVLGDPGSRWKMRW